MKHLFYITISLLLLILSGCKNEDPNDQHFDNKLYIAASTFTTDVLLLDDVVTATREIEVSMAKPESHDVEVVFATAPEQTALYRAFYNDPDVLVLPSSCCRIVTPSITISAGSVSGTPVTVEFMNLESLDHDARYVMPVTIASVNGVDLLDSAKSFYYLFKRGALINVVADLSGTCAYPEWGEFDEVADMSTFTFEALLNVKKFPRDISTIMGIEDKFLVRLGDNGVDPNQIQIAAGSGSSNKATSSSLQLKANRWYHLAVTFDNGAVNCYLDGVKKTLDRNQLGCSSVNFKVSHSDEMNNRPRCFWIGHSYDNTRSLDGMISEVRVWNRVLSGDEINAVNHFYTIPSDSEGLVAYWKFNDGSGNIVKDHTQYGNNLTIANAPQWITVELPAK